MNKTKYIVYVIKWLPWSTVSLVDTVLFSTILLAHFGEASIRSSRYSIRFFNAMFSPLVFRLHYSDFSLQFPFYEEIYFLKNWYIRLTEWKRSIFQLISVPPRAVLHPLDVYHQVRQWQEWRRHCAGDSRFKFLNNWRLLGENRNWHRKSPILTWNSFFFQNWRLLQRFTVDNCWNYESMTQN